MSVTYPAFSFKIPSPSMEKTLMVKDRFFIKRVIGLPGEVVEIKDGKVYIDGSPTPLDDSFIPEKMIGSYGPYTVPENCYFMLGDNRNDSKDSRFFDIAKFLYYQIFCDG